MVPKNGSVDDKHSEHRFVRSEVIVDAANADNYRDLSCNLAADDSSRQENPSKKLY